METKIQVKIKMEKGKEITLNQKEARELYEKLGEIFEEKTKIQKEYVPFYPYKYNPWWTQPYIYTTSDGTGTITIYNDKVTSNTAILSDVNNYSLAQ